MGTGRYGSKHSSRLSENTPNSSNLDKSYDKQLANTVLNNVLEQSRSEFPNGDVLINPLYDEQLGSLDFGSLGRQKLDAIKTARRELGVDIDTFYNNIRNSPTVTIDIKDIVSEQEWVFTEGVQTYINKGDTSFGANSTDLESRPILFKVGDKYVIDNGNHRILAMTWGGVSKVHAHIFDLNPYIKKK